MPLFQVMAELGQPEANDDNDWSSYSSYESDDLDEDINVPEQDSPSQHTDVEIELITEDESIKSTEEEIDSAEGTGVKDEATKKDDISDGYVEDTEVKDEAAKKKDDQDVYVELTGIKDEASRKTVTSDVSLEETEVKDEASKRKDDSDVSVEEIDIKDEASRKNDTSDVSIEETDINYEASKTKDDSDVSVEETQIDFQKADTEKANVNNDSVDKSLNLLEYSIISYPQDDNSREGNTNNVEIFKTEKGQTSLPHGCSNTGCNDEDLNLSESIGEQKQVLADGNLNSLENDSDDEFHECQSELASGMQDIGMRKKLDGTTCEDGTKHQDNSSKKSMLDKISMFQSTGAQQHDVKRNSTGLQHRTSQPETTDSLAEDSTPPPTGPKSLKVREVQKTFTWDGESMEPISEIDHQIEEQQISVTKAIDQQQCKQPEIKAIKVEHAHSLKMDQNAKRNKTTQDQHTGPVSFPMVHMPNPRTGQKNPRMSAHLSQKPQSPSMVKGVDKRKSSGKVQNPNPIPKVQTVDSSLCETQKMSSAAKKELPKKGDSNQLNTETKKLKDTKRIHEQPKPDSAKVRQKHSNKSPQDKALKSTEVRRNAPIKKDELRSKKDRNQGARASISCEYSLTSSYSFKHSSTQ